MRHGEGSALVEGFYQYTGTERPAGCVLPESAGGTSVSKWLLTRLQVSGKMTTSTGTAKPAGSTARRMTACGLGASGRPHSKSATVSSLSSYSCGQTAQNSWGCAGLAKAS